MEKWWNATFCLEFFFFFVFEKRWDDWKHIWQLLSYWVYFSCAVPFLCSVIAVCSLCLGWHLGLKIDRLSCQQSEEDVRNKIFLQRNFGGFIILLFHRNFPFESIHKLLFAKTRNPPWVCSLSRGESSLHEMTNEMNCIGNKEMCLSFLSRRMKELDIESDML